MLIVWGRPTSVNVQKPMWLIGELALAHQRNDVGGAFGGLDTDQYISMNPHQLIPTLQDDTVTVWESEAILRYIAGKYGEQYFPADPSARAGIDQWMSWVQSTWAPAMTAVFGSLVRVATTDRDPTVFASYVSNLHKVAARIDQILMSRPYLAGESLSLADFAFASFLYRYYTLEISRPELPHLNNYYDRLCERPAYVEHVQVDYDGLRVPGAERQ